jgi:glutathione S-transferase
VAWALEEAGADYNYVKIDLFKGEGRSPEYLRVNPGGKVPALVEDDFVLTETAAILNYIGDHYPDSGLTPLPGTKDRALYDRWCFFSVAELEQPLWTWGKHTFALPEDWRVPAVINTAAKEFAVALKLMEAGLGDKPFILGNQFTAADIMLALNLAWANKINMLPEDSAIAQAYMNRALSRPALARAREREKAA